jgi:hypothetical protein
MRGRLLLRTGSSSEQAPPQNRLLLRTGSSSEQAPPQAPPHELKKHRVLFSKRIQLTALSAEAERGFTHCARVLPRKRFTLRKTYSTIACSNRTQHLGSFAYATFYTFIR